MPVPKVSSSLFIQLLEENPLARYKSPICRLWRECVNTLSSITKMSKDPPLRGAASIRLLIVHPGAGEEKLKGSFKLEDLNSLHLEYEALSYYWGPAVFLRKILIDGVRHQITQTLYDALVRLRLPNTERDLWADAVCINQSSNEERKHQVRLMKRIYSQCARCVVYLGPEADGSESVPELVKHLLEWVVTNGHLDKPLGLITPDMHESLGIPPASDPRWAAIRALLRRPWFRRLWVVQESTLPKQVFMICGRWGMDSTALGLFSGLYHKAFTLLAVWYEDSSHVEKESRAEVADELRRSNEALTYHTLIRRALDKTVRAEVPAGSWRQSFWRIFECTASSAFRRAAT